MIAWQEPILLSADASSVTANCANLRRKRNSLHVRLWHIATFRCAAEFGRYRGIANSGEPSAQQICGFTA